MIAFQTSRHHAEHMKTNHPDKPRMSYGRISANANALAAIKAVCAKR